MKVSPVGVLCAGFMAVASLVYQGAKADADREAPQRFAGPSSQSGQTNSILRNPSRRGFHAFGKSFGRDSDSWTGYNQHSR